MSEFGARLIEREHYKKRIRDLEEERKIYGNAISSLTKMLDEIREKDKDYQQNMLELEELRYHRQDYIRCMERSQLILDNMKTLYVNARADKSLDELSDGYHTFKQLYDQRALLLAVLMSTDYNGENIFHCWKSLKHNDPNFPMYEDMFIVGGTLPHVYNGDFTFHIDIGWWYKFKVEILDKAPEYDGHSVEDVMDRICEYLS